MLPKSPAAEPQWPPRSPHEALLSTPGGRARLRRMAERQTSPSPLRSRTPGGGRGRRLFQDEDDNDTMGDENNPAEEDDDEETLQLQLQLIQAKLRLKKLQAAKAHDAGTTSPTKTLSGGTIGRTAGDTIRSSTAMSGRLGETGGAGLTTAGSLRARSPQKTTAAAAAAIEVPASPVRRTQSAASGRPTDVTQKSPRRVLLGIDKGLRGQDVSLKRAPSSLRRRAGGAANTPGSAAAAAAAAPARPLSFNERLAAARTQEAARQDKAERIQKARTSAFSVGRAEMEDYKAKAAADLPALDRPPATASKLPPQQQYSRDDILGGQGPGRFLHRSRTTPDLRTQRSGEEAEDPFAAADKKPDDADGGGGGGGGGGESFEPYSGFHLSKRVLPHAVVARAVSGKTTYSLQDLLREVKAPDFALPEVETDVVVLAIVAAKSDPRAHKQPGGATAALNDSSNQGKNQHDRGKYMVLTLVDLTYQVDLFLFKTGFDRFWKLPTGTVVAILNPVVMPPPKGRQDTGRWGLVINSDEDTILEIGTARDLGYCKSIKRDGQLCSAWVNAKRTEFCEFHMNEAVRKMRATRNEINGAAGFGLDERRNNGNNNKYAKYHKSNNKNATTGYDSFTQSQWYVSGGGGGGGGGGGRSSASSLLDRDDGGYSDKVERKEGIKRRLAAKERETDIARKLGELGSGAGRDYMKLTARDRAAEKAAAAAEAEKKKKPSLGTSAAGTASLSSTSSTRSATLSSASSAATSLTSLATTTTTIGSRAEQAAASRASLLASVASRRGGGAGGGGLNSSSIASSSSQSDLFDGGQQLTASPMIHLSPVKRKRPQSSLSSTLTSAGGGRGGGGGGANTHNRHTGGLGWGTDLTAKLGRMKQGEKLVPSSILSSVAASTAGRPGAGVDSSQTQATPSSDRSPVRKKTRFFLGEKGIREAGRESLGTTVTGSGAAGSSGHHPATIEFDLEDDELVII